MMEEFEKIAVIENEVEALYLAGELEKRGIPHAMRSYHDSAYDGLFQFSAGWGHVEAPAPCRDEIMAIIADIRRRHPRHDDGTDGTGDRGQEL